MARTSFRRSRAMKTAATQPSRARTQIQSATNRRRRVRSCAVSSWSASKTVIDAGVLGKPVGEVRRDRKLLGELDQQRAEVDGHDAALGLEEHGLVVEHADDLRLRRADRGDPELLEPRAVEDAERDALGEGTERARDRAGEPLLLGRQPLLERRLHVDLREELVGQRRCDLLLDHLVVDQLPRGLLELAPVERLALHEVGRDRHHDEEHAEHGEQTCERPPPPSRTARFLVHAFASSALTAGTGAGSA